MTRTPAPERRQRLAASARRAQLVEVGRMVFAQHGYEATSVEEIAERAGISKPIVYEHFGGKEGLYAVIVDREVEHIVGRIVEAISSGSPRERLERAALAFLTYVKERPNGFAVLLRDAPRVEAERRDAGPEVRPRGPGGRHLHPAVPQGRLRCQGGAHLRAGARRHGRLRRAVVDREPEGAAGGDGGEPHRGAGVDGAPRPAEAAGLAGHDGTAGV